MPGTKLPDKLMWAHMRADELIKSPKEDIKVFDFETVCRRTFSHAHFGFMASGIETSPRCAANREGFLKIQPVPAGWSRARG